MKSLLNLTIPVFETGVQLRGQTDFNLTQLQKELLTELDHFESQAKNEGHSSSVIDDSKYALAAWLDEFIYTQTNISLDWFAHSLVVQLYGDSAAGANFFNKMDALHRNGNKTDVLMVYLRCLLIGFQGKYRLESSDQLSQVIHEIQSKNPNLHSFEWESSAQEPGVLPKDKHGVKVLSVSLGALILSIAVYVFMAFYTAFGV